MSREISAINIEIINGMNVSESETKRALTLIADWITNIEERLNQRVEDLTANKKALRDDRQFKVNVAFSIVITVETALLLLMGLKVI